MSDPKLFILSMSYPSMVIGLLNPNLVCEYDTHKGKIISCGNILKADEVIIKEGLDDFIAFLINPNMDPTGLPDGLAEKTYGGLLTGCYWIESKLKKVEDTKKYDNRVIFLNMYGPSAYERISNWISEREIQFYQLIDLKETIYEKETSTKLIGMIMKGKLTDAELKFLDEIRRYKTT